MIFIPGSGGGAALTYHDISQVSTQVSIVNAGTGVQTAFDFAADAALYIAPPKLLNVLVDFHTFANNPQAGALINETFSFQDTDATGNALSCLWRTTAIVVDTNLNQNYFYDFSAVLAPFDFNGSTTFKIWTFCNISDLGVFNDPAQNTLSLQVLGYYT